MHPGQCVLSKGSKEENSALHHSEEPADFCAFISEIIYFMELFITSEESTQYLSGPGLT